MEIEYKNRKFKIKDIYQVGNVISRSGKIFLVAETAYFGKTEYCFVNLENGKIFTPMFKNLERLYLDYGRSEDRLVKAKLTIDYKLDEDTEDYKFDGGTEDEN